MQGKRDIERKCFLLWQGLTAISCTLKSSAEVQPPYCSLPSCHSDPRAVCRLASTLRCGILLGLNLPRENNFYASVHGFRGKTTQSSLNSVIKPQHPGQLCIKRVRWPPSFGMSSIMPRPAVMIPICAKRKTPSMMFRRHCISCCPHSRKT
ncbi:hypothetical protein IWX90DRAFT_149509 [Phyllosticta citrichinensis]|uniref:Secreted protein n=1 Tax=Phyllosticta citrichinensis TaxID=1130410 RepID=A0ABR1XZR6_9PEZI